MADFLRVDTRIVMGRERYAWVNARGEMQPEHFSRHRFCLDFRLNDSHHQVHQPYYGEAAQYFDSALWVGDKLPNLFETYDQFFDRFANASVIYMLREPIAVATSYQARADATKKALAQGASQERLWPVDRGWESGVDEWNHSVRATLERLETKRFLIVDYDALYRDIRQLVYLYQFMNMDAPPHILDTWSRKSEEREEIESRRAAPVPSPHIEAIRKRADWNALALLKDVAARSPR
jgi:hypothetical protein